MFKLAKLGVVAALVLGGTSFAIAQDAPAAGTDTKPMVDATTTGSVGGSFDTLLSTINSDATVDVAGITDATTVNFVTVSSLQGADPAALDTAIQGKTDAMASMHSSIDSNAALKAKLEAAGYTSADVLAIESGADGAFTVYIDDRA